VTAAEAQRRTQLLAEAREAYEAQWDDATAMLRYAERPDYHNPRGTLAYARLLLEDGAPPAVERARRALAAVLAMQERTRGDAHEGNFRWTLEDEGVTDLNAVEFMLDALIPIAREHAAELGDGPAAATREAIALGLREIDRLDVHLSYTNIALSDIANSVLGGELLGDARMVTRGARRLRDWLSVTNATGVPHEYNSPTYCGVDLLRLAALAAETRDREIAALARDGEALVWRHVAARYHPGLAQLAGPHSRSYFDGWTGASGLLKLLLWRVLGDDRLRGATPYARRTREEGHAEIAWAELHIPDDALAALHAKRWPHDVRESADPARGVEIVTHMTASYALGTATRSYTVGEPPEQWPAPNGLLLHIRRDAPPGYGVLTARYVLDGHAPGTAMHTSDRTQEDWWDEGQFVAAQEGNRAVIAYGLLPRLRPLRSAALVVRLLGAAGARLHAGDRDVADGERVRIEPAARICIAAGDAYVALIPLRPDDMGSGAAVTLAREGEALTLEIENYRGPAKQFWEYRSLGGPFFQRNVRNAVIIEVAERGRYAGFDAFVAHVQDAAIHDELAGGVRTIRYDCACGGLPLGYDLRTMTRVP
jgi:hypothetical protein